MVGREAASSGKARRSEADAGWLSALRESWNRRGNASEDGGWRTEDGWGGGGGLDREKRKQNQNAATWNLCADLIVYSETKEGCG